MLFYMVTGYSESSEMDAVSNALGAAVGLGEEAESVHILIMSIARIGDGWQVMVKVVIEPRVKPKEKDLQVEEEARRLRKKHEEEEADVFVPLIHFYAHTEHHGLLEDFLLEQDMESFVHIIEEGPLWEEAVHYFPDVEFYEAAHPVPVQTYDTSHPDTNLELNRFVDKLRKAHVSIEPALED